PQPKRLAHTLSEAMAKRPADHLNTRRRVKRAHVEPAAVGTISRELRNRNDAALGKRRPQRDRIVAGRKQEAIAVRPGEVLRVIAQLMEIESGEKIGDTEPLADIALPLATRHGEHMPPELGRPNLEPGQIGRFR